MSNGGFRQKSSASRSLVEISNSNNSLRFRCHEINYNPSKAPRRDFMPNRQLFSGFRSYLLAACAGAAVGLLDYLLGNPESSDSSGRDEEVHRDFGLRLDRPPILEVRLEAPLADSFTRRRGKNRRSTQHP
jgi:hypothetical protein